MLPLQFGDTQCFVARARPEHVEVLERDGRHVTIRVRDITFTARCAITATALVLATALRVQRRMRGSTT